MTQSFLIISRQWKFPRGVEERDRILLSAVSIYGNRVNLRDSISGSNTGFARAKKSDIVARRSRGKDQYHLLAQLPWISAKLASIFPSRTPALPRLRLTHVRGSYENVPYKYIAEQK